MAGLISLIGPTNNGGRFMIPVEKIVVVEETGGPKLKERRINILHGVENDGRGPAIKVRDGLDMDDLHNALLSCPQLPG